MVSVVKKAGILPWVLLAIVLGVLFGQFLPQAISRVFFTFNDIFAEFLNFSIPLIIVGLVVPAIADLGKGAGKWLSITAIIAYVSTLFAAFLTYFVAKGVFPHILTAGAFDKVDTANTDGFSGYFTIEIPELFGVMSALVLSFVMGIGLSLVPRGVLRKGFVEFREIISALISKIIIPLLPLHIFGIFLNLTESGEAAAIIQVLLKVVVVVLLLEVVILLTQYSVAGAVAHRNPIKALVTMLPAYFTALGTSSSAATIPVTLRQARANGISEPVANFTIPLCATIHLSGSASKITAFAMAIIFVNGLPVTDGQLVGFIFMLGITMVAAPGVPGGAIMAATGILSSMLGFGDQDVALMIATYIALDSFGTATNVTGDGAIAILMDKIAGAKIGEATENADGFASMASFDASMYLKDVSR
ncbi:MAG: dicarboxylate/amino acid:cation symporter [Ancrocorticia sp.]|nr:dicarboxylate/amino acid:cation symporter [Ancrocorticia sp.]MCI1896177.1 dicarboxylate/amino acid:cation symporter [Ancrocorticia sp.]MCI1932884.1 dicarboxylate/amino acid:cation symporter [Ancrocorticia sp.]MCI1963196.1 dicarboxylate/amino acid:cation symporter [Ancrocorticia sp.]MCI2013012.1 dicarboxylate/amino acid:cation symporter [Ancrocorticia sp.]